MRSLPIAPARSNVTIAKTRNEAAAAHPMTALTKYARLEATALWRASSDEQRREVVVSIGDATLVIIDMNNQPLTHWSLAAVERANPDQRPAIFYPDGDPGETLELPEAEAEMIDAIETLRKAIEKTRPRPGRLYRHHSEQQCCRLHPPCHWLLRRGDAECIGLPITLQITARVTWSG